MPAESDSTVNQTQAGSQTGGAQAGAGSAAQQAGSQTGQAQAGAGAAGQLAQQETVSDVGQGEAWIVNMKRLVENALNLDEQLKAILVSSTQRAINVSADHDQRLRTLAETNLANSIALANRVNNSSVDLDTRIKQNAIDSDGRKTGNDEQYDKAMDSLSQSERERTIRGGDAGDVIRWAGLSENPIFQDAISAAVAREMAKQKAATA